MAGAEKPVYLDDPELPVFSFFFEEELSELEDDSDFELLEESGPELFLA